MFLGIKLIVLLSVAVFGDNVNSKKTSGDEPLNLTPLVEKGQAAEARKLSTVDPTLFAGLHSHAAYFNVDKIKKWNLFFWFFPVPHQNLESAPLIIWLQGGPGTTSMLGLFNEIGPLKIVNDSAHAMPITWGAEHSLLFIDNPVGAGYSYTEDDEYYASNEDEVGAALLSFLQQFLQVFPELRKSPLFIAGQSYAGKFVTAFGHYIHHRNDTQPINFRGLAIGDGWIDPISQVQYSDFALQVGLIDPELAKRMKIQEDAAVKACEKGDYDKCGEYAEVGFGFMAQASNTNIYNYLETIGDDKRMYEISDFMNRDDVRSALHVGENTRFNTFNIVAYNTLGDEYYRSVKPWLEELLEHYGVMCYNGQLDVQMPYAVSVNMYRGLKWSGAEAYRRSQRMQIIFKKDVVGFVKGAGNFMEAMVKGAGQMVAADKPEAALQLIHMCVNEFS